MSPAAVPRDLRAFLQGRTDVHAIHQRAGLRTHDLVIVDADGDWIHWVVESDDAARALAEAAGMTLHEGWNDELAKRVNNRDNWKDPSGRRRAL
jgi:hypothetical protein